MNFIDKFMHCQNVMRQHSALKNLLADRVYFQEKTGHFCWVNKEDEPSMGTYCVAMLDCADQKLAMMVTLTTISP